MARAATIPTQPLPDASTSAVPAQSPPRTRRTRSTRATTTIATAATGTEKSSSRAAKKAAGSLEVPTTVAKRGRKPRGKQQPKNSSFATASNLVRSLDIEEGTETEDEIGFEAHMASSTASKSSILASSPRLNRTANRASRVVAFPEVDENDDDDDELAQSDVQQSPRVKPTSTKTASKPKLSKSSISRKVDPEQTGNIPPKPTRGRRSKNTSTVTSTATNTDLMSETAKRPRGRPPVNKTSDTATLSPTASTIPSQITISTKSLRGIRGFAAPSKKKKTVTFADLCGDTESEEDLVAGPSEDALPVPRARDKTSTTLPGLRAKPVRKTGAPVAVSIATRSQKPKSTNANTVKPLSPKKATQMAKSGSSVDSDEIGEEERSNVKNTIHLVVKSPTKPPTEPAGLRSPVKKINFTGKTNYTENDENVVSGALSSTIEAAELPFMGSPARRLPASPVKDIIRESPRRGALFAGMQTSLSRPDATTPNKISPLKVSPKKGGTLGASFLAPAQNTGSNPFNARISLLQSPAKRTYSPFRFKVVNKMPTKVSADEQKNSVDDVFGPSSDDLQIEDCEFIADQNLDTKQGEPPGLPLAPTCVNDILVEQSADDTGGYVETPSEGHYADPKRVNAPEELEHEPLSEDDSGINGHLNDLDVTGLIQAIRIPQEVHNVVAENEINYAGHSEENSQREEFPVEDGKSDEGEAYADSANGKNQLIIHADREEDAASEDSHGENEHGSFSPVASLVSNDSVNVQSPLSAYEVSEIEDLPTPTRLLRKIPPPAPSPPAALFYPTRCGYREVVDCDVTDDEGRSEDIMETPLFHQADTSVHSSEISGTNVPLSAASKSRDENSIPIFTPLIEKLSRWRASSPDKSRPQHVERCIFSPVIPAKLEIPPNKMESRTFQLKASRKSIALRRSLLSSSTDGQSRPDDEILINNQSYTGGTSSSPRRDVNGDLQERNATGSQDNQSDQIIPTSSDPSEDDKENRGVQQLSMSITPVRINHGASRTIHTVSKVPLKPEGQISPLKIPRKRTRSLSGGSLPSWRISCKPQFPAKSQSMPSLSTEQKSHQTCQYDQQGNEQNMTVDSCPDSETVTDSPSTSTAPTPIKIPRRTQGSDQQLLQGVVAYVDVHTTEGEDASGIFVELLTQMGARCVRGWSWNPRTSLSPVDGVDPKEAKIGITHVIFKDGGVRTLEKVRWACDLVKCVGVGWVLDCEREQKWLEESLYSVDCSIIPRGGSKRRKSMQPRALCNDNGSLRSPVNDKRPGADGETVEEFLRLSQNTPPGPSVLDPSQSKGQGVGSPKTPSQLGLDDYVFDFDAIGMSPATPYFLSNGAKLIQQTCPSKQTRQGLFDSLPSLDSDASFRAKLEAARRKSLFYQPKVGSPLGR